MKRILIILICFLNLCSCHLKSDHVIEPIKFLPNEKQISKITCTSKENILFKSEQKELIYKFLESLHIAKQDFSDDDFKSFKFCSFTRSDSSIFRIEILNNRFRYKMHRYIIEENIEQLLKEIFQVKF